jgi:hypothetical protein
MAVTDLIPIFVPPAAATTPTNGQLILGALRK